MIYDMEFELYLIRHGESEVNVRPDEMGQLPDVKLTENGKKQALLLRDYLEKQNIIFDRIYTSPYLRAKKTAFLSLVDDNQIIVLADELREYDAGKWTGASRSATLTPDVVHRMNVFHNNFLPPDGESISQIGRRASKWLEDEILYNENMWETCNYISSKGNVAKIAAYSHGMTIKSLLHYIVGFDKSFIWKISIDNTSISKLSFGKKGWMLHSINDTSHLK